MNCCNYRIPSVFMFSLLLICIATEASAQETNDEMKRKLRESLIVPELNPSKQKIAPIRLQPLQKQDEILKVSPTTKLPTKFDRIETLHAPEVYKIRLDLTVTNKRDSLVLEKIDYSSGKLHPIPDPRSTAHFTQYTGMGGSGIVIVVGDFDPVRAVQRHKARKRQEKVNRILKAYSQD